MKQTSVGKWGKSVSVFLFILACSVRLHAVTFATNAWIGDGDTGYDGQTVIVSNSTLTIDGIHVFDAVQIINTGVITHTMNTSGLVLTVSNTVSVDATSRIDASARGTLAPSGTTGHAGGSYGGRGGQYSSGTSCATYGDAFTPESLGSGGAGGTRGGGRIDFRRPHYS